MIDQTTEPNGSLPNEVTIEVNDNTTAYNHNVAVRMSDGSGKTTPEELANIAMERIKEIRVIIKSGSKY